MQDLSNQTIFIAGQHNIPEVFYTLEGEGRWIGWPSVFLRLSGCNLTCSGFASKDSVHGCDSYVSWSVKNKTTFKELDELLVRDGHYDKLLNGAVWKITGGEPLIQQKSLTKFFQYIFETHVIDSKILKIDFETNGTITPDGELIKVIPNVTFTVSPKLYNNGDSLHLRFKEKTLKWHAERNSCFKFVVQNEDDVKEIWEYYIENNNVGINKENVWFMPCCGSQKELLENGTAVAELAKTYGVKFSNRLHLQLWDKALRV